MPVSNLKCGCQHSESTHRHACASVYSLRVVQRSAAAASTPSVQLPPNLNQPGRQKAAPVSRVGRGAGALGARGTKKRRPRLGRGALQNFRGAEIQNQYNTGLCRTRIRERFVMWTTPLPVYV